MPALTLLPIITAIPWRAIGIALVAALLFGAGWTVNGWRYEGRIAKSTAQAAFDQTTASEKARMDEQTWRNRYAALDQETTRKMSEARNEIEALRARVESGAVRLRVSATCPGKTDLHAGAGATGLDHGAGAELDPDARSAYFALRAGLIRVETKLAAAQDALIICRDMTGATDGGAAK